MERGFIENFEKIGNSKFSKKNFDAISSGNVNKSKFSIDRFGLFRKKWKPKVKTPFFIFFQERSGSSLLRILLNSHKDIYNDGEIFYCNKSLVIQTGRKERAEVYPDANFTRRVLDKIYSKEKLASGFKFKYPIQYNLYPDVWNYLLKLGKKVRVIFIYRRNALKAVISMQNRKRLVEISGKSQIYKNSNVNLCKLDLNVSKAINDMKKRQENDIYFYNKIKKFKHRLVISYEDLFYYRDNTIKKVLDFLGVPVDLNLREQTKKITPDNLRDAISNYDELVEALKGTKFEKYLYD